MRSLFDHRALGAASLGRCLRWAAVAVGLGIPAFFAYTVSAHRVRDLADAERQVADTALALEHHATRPYDTVARIGGDEFAVVLAYLDDPGAAACLAERLIAAVGEPIDLDGQTIEVGVSVGLVIATERDGDADELFKRADIALYGAKAAGRNTHRAFCPDTGARIATRGQLGLDMKEAIRMPHARVSPSPATHAERSP